MERAISHHVSPAPLQAGFAELGLGWIVAMIGGTEQRGAFVDLQGDVALQHDRRAKIRPGNQSNRAAASLFACIDGRLNCGGIFGDAITLGTILARIAGVGQIERACRNAREHSRYSHQKQ